VRMPEPRIAHYAKEARAYLEKLVALDPELAAALAAKDFGPLIVAGREREHSRVLFRPIGLTIFSRVIAELVKRGYSLNQAFAIAKRIPLNLGDMPFANMIWDPKRNRMTTGNAPLCISLLLYLLGEAPADRKLKERYAKFKGVPVEKVRMPPRFKA
jgi:DNA sulfur modification protein DndB